MPRELEIAFRPLRTRPADWKPAGASRPPSPFQASYEATLRLLANEIRRMGGTQAFIQVDVPDGGVRKDGMLNARAWPIHQGVMVTIEHRKHGTLIYSSDAFNHWHANLRAIALGLSDLRRLERYGIAKRGQQYAGFRELGSGMAMGSGEMSVDEAAMLLCDATADIVGEDPSDIARVASVAKSLFLEAAKIHHPDVGGDEAMFKKLTEARDVIDRFAATR